VVTAFRGSHYEFVEHPHSVFWLPRFHDAQVGTTEAWIRQMFGPHIRVIQESRRDKEIPDPVVAELDAFLYAGRTTEGAADQQPALNKARLFRCKLPPI
jgi:hypothetical protein